MNMNQLNNRQYQIYNYIRSRNSASNKEIRQYLTDFSNEISRVTIIRDIEVLLKNNYIKKIGEGRNIRYAGYTDNFLLKYFNSAEYFKIEPDNRKITENFNFDIFNQFIEIFTPQELKKLNNLTNEYRKNIETINPAIYRKEIERLTIELSWKSSQIEGNTYSLLDTEALIKENREAPGHNREESIMILNHKNALDYIFMNSDYFQKLDIRKIEDIHRILVDGLSIDFGLRNSLIRITGTKYNPLDNKYQIQEALEKTVSLINNYSDQFHKAISAIALLSYIQPFIDGNKRTGRLVGNAILAAANSCPLSYRSVDSVEYKKAMLLFYEQNSMVYFKELFIQQYEFSVKNYFIS